MIAVGGTIVLCSLFSAGVSTYSFLVLGPNKYPDMPQFFIACWAIGIPGAIIILILLMFVFGWFFFCFGNWVLFGQFRYFLKENS